MTSPTTPPNPFAAPPVAPGAPKPGDQWKAITGQDESAAMNDISSMLVGTSKLADEPGVVYALQQQKARPQDAQAIDQFMQGLDVEKQVRLAQATGQKIVLSADEKAQLTSMGVNDWQGSEFTQQDAAEVGAQQIATQSGGALEAKRDSSGKVIVDANGEIEKQAVDDSKPKKESGWGRLFSGLKTITSPITKSANYVGTELSDASHSFINETESLFSGPQVSGGGELRTDNNSAAVQQSNANDARDAEMKALGYDPGNVFSVMAFKASGKAHSDTTDLASGWDQSNPSGMFGMNGDQAVTEAEQYLDDPKGYQTALLGDTALTPDQQSQKEKVLASPQFAQLVNQVSARSATIGNDTANAIGLKPGTAGYALTTAGTNLAVSFAVDPTLVLGGVVKAAKAAQVGIDSLADSERAASILDAGKSMLPWVGNVQRGTLTAVKLSGEMRTAAEAGDDVAAAAKFAQLKAEVPAWAPLAAELNGTSRVVGRDAATGELIMGTGEPMRTLGDVADYVRSTNALTRLANGRAATQASLMPGALSAFGYRKVKGAVSAAMTTRSLTRAEGAYSKVTDAARLDPVLAEKLISDGDLIRMMPEADDAIDAVSGTVLGSKLDAAAQDLASAKAAMASHMGTDWENVEQTEKLQTAVDEASARHEALLGPASDAAGASAQQGKLASQARGASTRGVADLALTAAGKGKAAFNLRRTGNALGTSDVAKLHEAGLDTKGLTFGWASPTAVAARTRLAGQRWSTLLPRNTVIDLNDPESAGKIYRMGMTYMNRGEANKLAAMWATGDAGTRKSIVTGMIDQIGHAAGLGRTKNGLKVMDTAKTTVEAYSSHGDEVMLNGQARALHAGQATDSWTLPSFRDVQMASSKVGLWEGTMGRLLTHQRADDGMSGWKISKLFKPSTVTRNNLEGWLRTMIEGKLGPALQGRIMLTTPMKELWAKGLAADTKAEHDALLAAGDEAGAKTIANASYLSGRKLGRSAPLTLLTQHGPLALTGRAYRAVAGRFMDEADLEAFGTLSKDDLSQLLEDYHRQVIEGDLGFRGGAKEAKEINKAGYGASKLRYGVNEAMRRPERSAQKITGWAEQDLNGTLGADRYANALAVRVNQSPGVAKAAMDVIEHPEEFPLDHVVQAMDDPAIQKRVGQLSYGKVYWQDETAGAEAIPATTPEQQAIGKQQWASKVVEDYRHLLTDASGTPNEKLMTEIRQTGVAPDSEWVMDKIPSGSRPESAYAPQYEALALGGERGFIKAIQDTLGAGYQWMVERPLQRMTTSPVMTANYVIARRSLNHIVEDMVGSGVTREAAEAVAKENALKTAMVQTEQLVDDPGLRSQLDIVGRNFFSFSRAVQAMGRRWGTALYQDPTRARKLMLSYEGSIQSGLVYDNEYGEPTFTYPGSGVMQALMREVQHVPGFEGIAKFPIAASMTGGVNLAVPGLDNPFRMSMSPMITIPMREVFKHLPDHRELFDEIDSAINGPVGQGDSIAEQLEPTAIKLFTSASGTDRNSALASSMMGAIANLEAGGQTPPPDASPAVRDAYLQNLKTQVRSQLFLRAVFGLFAPAPASQPTEATAGSAPDPQFAVMGVKSLDAEYKMILNDTGGDLGRANAIWAGMHPDKTVYEVGESSANASKVALPATQAALQWMQKNSGFVGQYKNVAAYFLPEASGGGDEFNDQAYKTQLELGLRQKKTPEQFYTDVRVRNAENTFYPMVDKYDAAIAQAKAADDGQRADQITYDKSRWETDFKNLNPLFQQKIDSFGDSRAAALGQLSNLQEMVAKGDVPNSQGPAVSLLLQEYNNFTTFVGQNNGDDDASKATRDGAYGTFNSWIGDFLQKNPGLADLYNGVFRAINSNFATVDATGVNS